MSFFSRWRRVRFIAQMEMTECGAASLGMVLAFHRCHVPLGELREACGVSRDGTSALDIVRAAETYGLDVDAYKMDVEELDEVELPAILHWELNHFLVLERKSASGYELVDPAVGRRTVSPAAFGRAFTGIVLQLRPGEDFERREAPARSTEVYRGLLRRLAKPVALTMLSALLLEAFTLLFPAATALVVDFVIRPKQVKWIGLLAVAFSAAVVLRAAVTMARDRILAGLEVRVDVELAATLVKHLLSLPTSFFSQRGAGDLACRVAGLLSVRERLARLVLAGFDVFLVLAYTALMVLYEPRLGLTVAGLYLALVLLLSLGRRRLGPALATRFIAQGRVQTALVQAFTDPETAKAFRAEALLVSRYAAARSQELNARIETETVLEIPKHLHVVFDALRMALVLWLGGKAVLDERMTVGVLASFVAIQTLVGPPLLRVVASLHDLGDLQPLLDRVDDVFETPPERTGAFVPDDIEGAITFENVSFRYGNRAPLLLNDVSFHIDAGERVAIAGASGSGKSTILRLLLGFLEPTSGRILLDGRDLREYDLEALRSAVGTVLAGGSFFDESVFDNITLGAPEATPGLVRGALEAACVADVIDTLPRGLLTPLGDGARRLSGGQRQRLLLTRALVKNPRMLLLDEASSALDAELEARVQAYLSRMRCTMVLIAHRLSAVRFADRLLFLENGKIVQDGPLSELARQPGPVQQLLVASEGRW